MFQRLLSNKVNVLTRFSLNIWQDDFLPASNETHIYWTVLLSAAPTVNLKKE